jgi:predicted glycoside hydrolase/deacetylase ChbG (UPF0249 family)
VTWGRSRPDLLSPPARAIGTRLPEQGGVADIRREVPHQLRLFREIVGRDPTHLDSHQHSHLKKPVRSIAIELAGELNIPLRHFAPTVRYCGTFYGQSTEGQPEHERMKVESLIQIIRSLPIGITELGVILCVGSADRTNVF